MRRYGIVIESSGNVQVSRKQDTYYLEIKEVSVNSIEKAAHLLKNRINLKVWKRQGNWHNNRLDIFCQFLGRILFICFLVNLIHTCMKSSKIHLIFNSHGNTACFVLLVIFQFMVRFEFIMKSSLIINMISILVLSDLFWWAGTLEQLSHCSCVLKQITKVVWEQLRCTMQMKAFRLNKYENCGKVLKYFDAFQLYRASVLSIGTFKISC